MFLEGNYTLTGSHNETSGIFGGTNPSDGQLEGSRMSIRAAQADGLKCEGPVTHSDGLGIIDQSGLMAQADCLKAGYCSTQALGTGHVG